MTVVAAGTEKDKGGAEVVKNLLNLGIEISLMAKAAGITEEEVKRLNDERNEKSQG